MPLSRQIWVTFAETHSTIDAKSAYKENKIEWYTKDSRKGNALSFFVMDDDKFRTHQYRTPCLNLCNYEPGICPPIALIARLGQNAFEESIFLCPNNTILHRVLSGVENRSMIFCVGWDQNRVACDKLLRSANNN
uniref:Uncharacterized protein n=1 Tax=Glossina austeni TaxID=7395 RepID=A0A1A9VLH2_GLOAU